MRIVSTISTYFLSSQFRHYSLSINKTGFPSAVSVRCNREKHYWEILTKYAVSILWIRFSVWKWIVFAKDCPPKKMRKDCANEGMKLTLSKWHALQPYEQPSEERSSLPAEKLLPS